MSRPQPAAGQDKPVSTVLKEAREDAGLSRNALAKLVAAELGVSSETARAELGKVERGLRPLSLRYAKPVAKVLKIPLARLRGASPPAELDVVLEAIDRVADRQERLVELVGQLLGQFRSDGKGRR